MEKRLRRKLRHGEFQNVTPQRSRTMSAIRGRGNITTEVRLRMGFVRNSVAGWTTHPNSIYGKPDFFFPSHNLAVFADGCFWHGCIRCSHIPANNTAYWEEKFRRNRARDRDTDGRLKSEGIEVLRFWEHEIRDNLNGCVEDVMEKLDGLGGGRRKGRQGIGRGLGPVNPRLIDDSPRLAGSNLE